MRRLAVILVAAAAVIGSILIIVGGIPGGGPGPTPDPTQPPVPPSSEIVVDGRAIPVRSAELGVAVPGVIAEVLVAEGDAVAAGEALVRLDATAAEAQVAAAQGSVTAAEAGLTRARAGEAQAIAQREAAAAQVDQARATVTRARATRDALPSGTSSAQRRAANADVDAALAALEVTRANLRAATGARDAASAAVAAAQADLDRAAAGLRGAEAAESQLTLTAPFAGTVASVDARTGEQAAPGIALVRVADTSGWLVETTDLDETTVGRVVVDAPVSIAFDGLPGETIGGTVRSIAMYGANVQGDVVYRAVIEPATIPAGLRWNMTATVTVDVAP